MADLDALVLPTTPIVAPKIAEVADADEFGRKNALLLRNTNPVNFFDLCAISLPLPRQDGLSIGLMLVGRNGQDRRLFNIAAAVENAPERLTKVAGAAACLSGPRPSTMNAKFQPSGEQTPCPNSATHH